MRLRLPVAKTVVCAARAAHLERYRQVGLDYALCGFESEDLGALLRQLRTFADQIAPRFADAG